MKKRGFSFVEVLIVIMIVGIMFVIFRGYFQIKNKDELYSQACIESIYGEVNNFLHAALSSKSLNSGGVAIFPNIYVITFEPSLQTIDLGYEEQNNPYTVYRSIPISGNTSNYCSSNSYTIVMSGDSYEIAIVKGLQSSQDRVFFSLSGAGISTGTNIFFQCNIQDKGCKIIARFESDTRTISIKKQLCLAFTGNDCLERDN